MKHVLFVMLVSCFVAACAGNPPAWWNPDNRYGTNQTPVKTTVRKIPAARDEMIELSDTSYEEETIDPLPEEDLSSQAGNEGVVQPETEGKTLSPQTAPVPSTETESGLPVPSVLE